MTDLVRKAAGEKEISCCFKERAKDANKGDFGYIALLGGSLPYSGAVRLAAMAGCAVRAGAGVVTAAVPGSIAYMVAEKVLEATVYPLSDEDGYIKFSEEELSGLVKRYGVIAAGMGMGNRKDTALCIEYLLKNYEGILVIDADGLNVLSGMDRDIVRKSRAKVVLTPHLKEFSRLSGIPLPEVIESEKGELAASLARELSCIVLLKGPVTAVTDGKTAYFVEKGCPGMATAGSGDVLSGILAAVLACNRDDILLAAAAAAWINGAAGELAQERYGQISMAASDTALAVRDVIKELSERRG